MIENHYLAGVVAGIPVSVLCLTYVSLRWRDVVKVLASGDNPLPEGAATALVFGTAAFLAPLLGVAAAYIYDRMGSEQQYILLALGMAVLMSAVALASKTPLLGEKIVLNFAVAVALGLFMPRLIAG